MTMGSNLAPHRFFFASVRKLHTALTIRLNTLLDRNQLEHLLKLAIHKLLFVWQSEFGRASASVKIALAKRIASRLGFGLMRTTRVMFNRTGFVIRSLNNKMFVMRLYSLNSPT